MAHAPHVGFGFAVAGLFLAGCCGCAVRWTRGRAEAFSGLVMALAVGASVSAFGAASAVDRRHPIEVTALVAQRATVAAKIRLTSDPRPVAGGRWEKDGTRTLVDATLVDVSWRGTRWSPGTPIQVAAGPSWLDTELDATYLATGVLSAPWDGAAPQAATLSVRSAPNRNADPRWPWRAAERVRQGLRAAVSGLPGSAPGLLPSLALGDSTRLPPELAADMRTAGLSHLSVVSGANVTLICGGLVAAVAWFGGGPRRQAVAGGIALAALVVVARPDPSVLRAAAMGAVGLLGVLIGRPSRALSALAAACCVLLIIDPWLSRSYGFALSAAATCGIVCLARPLSDRLQALLVPRAVALPLAVSLAAQVSVTPVLVLLNPSVATYSLVANLLVLPVVAPTMVLTTVVAVVAVASTAVAGWLAWPAAAGAAWVALVARVVARLPGAILPWWSGLPGVAAALVFGAAVVVAVLHGPRLVAAVGRRRVVAAALPLVLVAGCALGGGRLASRGPVVPADWVVVVCDVGQGEAVLVRTGPAAAILIDTGPEPGPMADCLHSAGVRVIVLLLLTHFHADHVGGLAAVLARTRVQQVWTSPQPSPAANATAVATALAAAGVPTAVAEAGDSFAQAGVRLDVLWPVSVLDRAGAESGDGTAINDASLVVRIESPGVTLLCLGDVETAAQRRLLAVGPAGTLDVDVTTIAHHGSGVQVPQLYDAASPLLAVASAGAHNDYGHPDPLTMAMVASTGARVLSTATAGEVWLTVDGDRAGGGALRVGYAGASHVAG